MLSISKPSQNIGPGIGFMISHIFQELFRVNPVRFDFGEGFAFGDSGFDCFVVCHGSLSLLSETKPYENRGGSYQKRLSVCVTVTGARKLLFTGEILAPDIYLGRVGLETGIKIAAAPDSDTPEERPGFQSPERHNLFDGVIVVDLAWHGFSPGECLWVSPTLLN
jgi:hypothetical protein